MGPRKRWALAFFAALFALYYPLTRFSEPRLRELWFQTVTRGLVTDAHGLQPPPHAMWLGASRPELPQSLYGIYELEKHLHCPIAITSIYQAWGDGDEHAFPLQVMRSLHKGDYLPMITWEPWLSAFRRFKGENPHGSLRKIARGEVDAYIRAWAREAVRYGRPFLLRPGHEGTNAWYGWSPEQGNDAEDFRAFWTHVRRIFRQEGARNALFVWTPFGLHDQDWFPGADAVDWIGFDVFNYGGLSEQGTWLDFYTLTKLFYDSYRDLGPPLMIAETATTSAGGNKADWVRDMFRSLRQGNFPRIRALVLFDQPAGHTGSGLAVDWSIAETSQIYPAIAREPQLVRAFTRERVKQP